MSGIPSSFGGLSLTGGVPTKSQDLAASIIFAVAYALLAVPIAIRLIIPSSRHLILLRPIIFLILQTVGVVLRAIIANGNTSTGMFIANQICSLAGFILICEPIVAMFQQVVALHVDSLPEHRAALLKRASVLVRIVLIVALILGIVAATKINGNMSQSDIDDVKSLREANSALAIACVGASIVGTGLLVVGGYAEMKHAMPIAFSGFFVLIVAAYKLDTTLHPTNPFATGTKVGFYLLLCLPQLLAALPFALLNIKQLFFPPSYEESERANKNVSAGRAPATDMEMGPTGGQGYPQQSRQAQGPAY